MTLFSASSSRSAEVCPLGGDFLDQTFPPDEKWRERTGALCEGVEREAYDRVFAAHSKGFTGENARVVWGWSRHGQYEGIAVPMEA
jgi:hypothetical protein